ncbi:hypothetical protein GUITHDRAFT_40307, partial [Guillardia theta CCMP2712]
FSWGFNNDGALGLGTTDAVGSPCPIIALQGLLVVSVACGGGSEEQHSAAVTEQGQVYTWGSGKSGQLGHGDSQNLVLPRLIVGLQSNPIVEVACGSAHTVVVSKAGLVFAWGWGHFGQLGVGSTHNSNDPVQVTSLDGVKVCKVACGSAHTAVVTESGHVYTWGWGVNGQLGHGDDASQSRPMYVKKLHGIYVSTLACGLAHTVVVSEVDRAVFSWGWDEYGQLGHGGWDIFGGNKNRSPRPIKDLQQIACGSSYTLALSSRGDVYAFGWGKDGQLG